MASTIANGIVIEYETVGDAADEPMLLVMGFGAQLVYWPPDLLTQLAGHGYYVIVYDNRDVGLSTRFSSFSSYSLDDMAADGIGLLDALGIDAAHLVGVSLGGFLVQLMATGHPSRVRSLCSIMSSTGDQSIPAPTAEAMAALVESPASDEDGYVEQAVRIAHVIGSRDLGVDDEWVEARARATFRRGVYAEGRMRQGMAVATAPDRTAALASVAVPTVVIHGADDPLVNVAGGEATAKAIPGAELVVIPGMGHDLPRPAWPTIVGAIVANASRTRAGR